MNNSERLVRAVQILEDNRMAWNVVRYSVSCERQGEVVAIEWTTHVLRGFLDNQGFKDGEDKWRVYDTPIGRELAEKLHIHKNDILWM